MEKTFVPRRTVTVQLTLDLHRKLGEIVRNTGQTRTRLLERLINQEYERMEMKNATEGTV